MCGQLDQALPHFQRVVDNYPDSEFREKAQEILASLQLANGTPPKSQLK
jgi:outer membrane protein assembly factor BamD (BamD/ComL family)